MKNVTMGRLGGFTLIELLVVVSIIGILASVAFPQYQKAVMKAQIASDLPLLISVLNAQDVYYLANGHYAFGFEDLDIALSSCTRQVEGDGIYCEFEPGAILKIFNGMGIYIARAGKYKLEFSYKQLEEGISCWTWTDNQTAEEVCRSYGGTEYPVPSSQPDYGKRFTIWKR